MAEKPTNFSDSIALFRPRDQSIRQIRSTDIGKMPDDA